MPGFQLTKDKAVLAKSVYTLPFLPKGMLEEKGRMEAIAGLIRDQIVLNGIDRYCRETGIGKEDFVEIKPQECQCLIFAIDGSNVPVCDWSVASLNKICAGYAVYSGCDWQRTVITCDDLFLADRENYVELFEPLLKDFFGLSRFSLASTELDRLSTYFRELQEYIALEDAIIHASPGDTILYDGGFDVYDPLRSVLRKIFRDAENRRVDLLGVAKSSAISWGSGISRPFVRHTGYCGGIFLPGLPWYLSLKGKKVASLPEWDGETFIVRFNGLGGAAFRVDVPPYMVNSIGKALEKLVMHSCSAECSGYPHALFRAHRDIRIREQEGHFLKLELMNILSDLGVSGTQIMDLMRDYHDVLEMRSRI
jgi:hypothetical protein